MCSSREACKAKGDRLKARVSRRADDLRRAWSYKLHVLWYAAAA